ncbi:helix-turn-helix domain-containing protein [Brucella anthropi]|uniref:helix-turn-helix domain-containing protein n=1 Tax=Brucella anthropi TaxID=529 RepID=UPI00235FFEFE|nr:helix-turn-helix domain-containing protein [Brucella anthropi]
MTKLYLSTASIDPSARNDFWSSIIRPIYEISSYDGDTTGLLEGEIWSYSTGPLTIGATSFNQQRYHRDKRLIGLTGLDFHLVQLITVGTLKGDFDGKTVSAIPSDIVIIDLARPVRSEATAGRRITTILPRDAINRAVAWRDIHGTVLPGHAAATRLIAHFLKGVLEVAHQLTPEEGATTQEAMIKLFVASLNNLSAPPRFGDETALNYRLKDAIVQYIEQNLFSYNLSIMSIQKRFNISRTHLYRLFEPENGISGFIKDKRLNLALRDLIGRPKRSVTAKELAYQYGFESAGAFNRLFRERFGMSAKEVIHEGHLTAMSTGSDFDLHSHIRTRVLTAAQTINNTPLYQ